MPITEVIGPDGVHARALPLGDLALCAVDIEAPCTVAAAARRNVDGLDLGHPPHELRQAMIRLGRAVRRHARELDRDQAASVETEIDAQGVVQRAQQQAGSQQQGQAQRHLPHQQDATRP